MKKVLVEERHVKPVVVVRPPSSYKNVKVKESDCIQVRACGSADEEYEIQLHNGKKDETFGFKNLYGYGGTNVDFLCKDHVEPLVAGCVQRGESAAVIAYGETGSGKSYISGTQNIAAEHVWQGSIGSYLCSRVFGLAKELDLKDFEVECSMIEIYKESLGKEQVYDLIDGFNRTKIEKYLSSKHNRPVTTPDELYDKLRQGSMLRNTDRTDGNIRSSRSHAIFTVSVSHSKGSNTVCKGKFLLVDLAGSESATQGDAGAQQRRQGTGINVGLLALQTVINDVSTTGSSVNYRMSRLTYDLRHALGGAGDSSGANCVFIGCISPFDSSIRTIQTLRYMKGVAKIKNVVQQNVIDMGNARCKSCRRLEKEIQDLKKSLAKEEGNRGAFVVLSKDEHKDMLKCMERDRAKIIALQEVIKTADANHAVLEERNRQLRHEIEASHGTEPQHGTSVEKSWTPMTPNITKPAVSVMSIDPLISMSEIPMDDIEAELSPEDLCLKDDTNLDPLDYTALLKIVSSQELENGKDSQEKYIDKLLWQRNMLFKVLHVYNGYLGCAKEERDIAETAHKQCLQLLSQAVKEKVQYVELAGQFSTALDISQADVSELQNELQNLKSPQAPGEGGHVMAGIFARLFPRKSQNQSPCNGSEKSLDSPSTDPLTTHPVDLIKDDEMNYSQ